MSTALPPETTELSAKLDPGHTAGLSPRRQQQRQEISAQPQDQAGTQASGLRTAAAQMAAM